MASLAGTGGAKKPSGMFGSLMNLGFNCPGGVAAEARIAHGVKAWRYRWMPVFPNQKLSEDAGAWHGIDLISVFGLERADDTADQTAFKKYVNTIWAKFAKSPQHGLSEAGLPVYDPNGK
jgi:cholinesterase